MVGAPPGVARTDESGRAPTALAMADETRLSFALFSLCFVSGYLASYVEKLYSGRVRPGINTYLPGLQAHDAHAYALAHTRTFLGSGTSALRGFGFATGSARRFGEGAARCYRVLPNRPIGGG